MSWVQHLSVRVPWHDTAWDGRVCADPRGNGSCVLLDNIGQNRDDDDEAAHAGLPFVSLATSPPCVMERGTFLSKDDLSYPRSHPWGYRPALKNIEPVDVEVPAFSVQGIPYFWLRRDTLTEHVMPQTPVDGYSDIAEDEAAAALGFRPPWVTHGDNQKAVIDAFFADVVTGESLVFFYAKHSPFPNDRVLVGAATITGVREPASWPTSGPNAFPANMWETVITHSLRPDDGTGGFILPLQELARRAEQGIDVSGAAPTPLSASREFAYVTEHVSPDTALTALIALQDASRAFQELGIPIPAASMTWLDAQIDTAWDRRGVAPGLPAVLEFLNFPHPTYAARTVISTIPVGEDPWPVLDDAMRGRPAPDPVTALATATRRKIWTGHTTEVMDALRLLARFPLTAAQVAAVIEDDTSIGIPAEDLLADPYCLIDCTVDDDEPIRFAAVDRGCFPPDQITARHPLPVSVPLVDLDDERRIRAAIVDAVAAAEVEGHTLLTVDMALERISSSATGQPLEITAATLSALGLTPDQFQEAEAGGDINWPVLVRTPVADGGQAYKLRSAATRGQVIRHMVDTLQAAPAHQVPADLGDAIDIALDALSNQDHPHVDDDDEAEARGREEKRAALAEMYRSRFTVLNGAAGTGKTTLVQALVNRPEIQAKGILLLAPTGKARVQLSTKVGTDAQTLAQFLSKSKRYDGAAMRYRITSDAGTRSTYGLVVVDEASMLTEDMLAALCDALNPPERFILVGDPRQLPPIGAGRPFVDLEAAGRAKWNGAWPRTADGWASLTVLRRQRGQLRDDLMLAQWFSGDEVPDSYDEVWERMRLGQDTPSLRAVAWDGRPPGAVLDQILEEELGITVDPKGLSFARSYGAADNNGWPSFPDDTTDCENWQILSPARGRAYGTVQMNRHLKRKHRGAALRSATSFRNRQVPKPFGDEQVVVGDKVVNLANATLPYWSSSTRQRGRGYVANGEIGVVIGMITRNSRQTQIAYATQPGLRYDATRSRSDDSALELAWALTIHKSQGSEFGLVILMLPANVGNLSRELVYTALTRQKTKVVVCHEGSLSELLDLTRASGSDTGRRLTDLVRPPAPVTWTPETGAIQVFDAGLVHVTANGVYVRSKNEVVIASILDQIAPGAWAYEQPLADSSGRQRWPDFTIATADGRTVYWEHLGMLNDPKYAADWERKKQWYADQGILDASPEAANGGLTGTLIVTDDRNGVDVPAWTEQAESVIGAARPVVKRTAKKTAVSPPKPT